MDYEEVKRSLCADLGAGLKRVVRELMAEEDYEVSQLLGNLLSGTEPDLHGAAAPGGDARSAHATEIAALFDALCASGYVDTAVSALIDLFRQAKGEPKDPRRLAFEAIFLEGARGAAPDRFLQALDSGELRPQILAPPPEELANIVRRAIDPVVGFVTPAQVEQQLHDFLEPWSNTFRANYGSWGGAFELE